MSRFLRIAHLGGKGIPSRGGTERVIEAIGMRHAAAGHEVVVYGSRLVCPGGIVDGMRVIALPASARKHLGPALLQLRCALHAVGRGGYDLIHLHGAENAFVLPILRTRYPVLTTNHGPAYLREKWGPAARSFLRSMEGFSIRGATAATAVAANQAADLTRRHGRAVRFVPNGIDPVAPAPDGDVRTFLQPHGLLPGNYAMFAAARVDPTKGCHTLLEAMALLTDLPPLPLLVLGDLGHAAGYEERLRALAGGLRVVFHPRIEDHALLAGLIASSRLFVFPSEVEAMSMMLLEALMTGADVVASAIPENLAILPPGVPTFRAGDAADLASAIRGRFAAHGGVPASAAAWVRDRYDWDRIASEYEEAYRSIVRRE